jgi:hypothetical protein
MWDWIVLYVVVIGLLAGIVLVFEPERSMARKGGV